MSTALGCIFQSSDYHIKHTDNEIKLSPSQQCIHLTDITKMITVIFIFKITKVISLQSIPKPDSSVKLELL